MRLNSPIVMCWDSLILVLVPYFFHDKSLKTDLIKNGFVKLVIIFTFDTKKYMHEDDEQPEFLFLKVCKITVAEKAYSLTCIYMRSLLRK